MKVQIYSSTNPILRLALEEIASQVKYPFDFVILAISPKYPSKDIPIYVLDILEIKEDQYLAFNAIDAFGNTDIVENGVVACFITFERKGSIKKFIKKTLQTVNFQS
ncbi:hypothetical protein [Desulfurobacterium thermolithotrophum]|uniref:hypothetical protein n=1 Tax=Desulfurobacterium thermolithotrophum TaxID=64160 RepID=UPI00031A2740|nr:hypothetical protein [Desulfurobacterium thermolithotrophum]